MSDKVIYTVGGTVQAGGGIYISRDADEELLQLCRAGEFCYVLTARQMGKSSLMVATRERLAAEGIRSVEIDLTKMGTELSGLTAEQWYLGLIDLIVDQLDLNVDYMAWWDERAHLGPTQRLSQFLRQVVLEQVPEPVVIFIDEIDSTLRFDFTDDFFAAIRACYNARASDPAFKRLSFVLLGVATPGDLISDPQRTPFNIGRGMDLTDFTERQATPLAAGLDVPPVEGGQIMTWILDWTGGHPYLTQRLCVAAAASPTKNWDAAAIDKLVEETFSSEQSAQDSNLRFVRDMLTQRAPDKAAVLKTYRRIHAGKAVSDEERSPVKTHLKLSGIVKTEDGSLHIRNKIYRRVFDLAWVRENTAVNWAPIVAGIAVLVALLAVGSILYNAWVGIQVQDCIANFYQANVPEERFAHLAKMFRLQGLFGPTDYDYQARELFYGLSREEQLALFNVPGVEESDLIVVIRGLYETLADVDGTDSTGLLLEVMARALDRLKGTEEAGKLKTEIDNWREGRRLVRESLYDEALEAYNNAIALSSENLATLYERARVQVELSQHQQALSDLDRVMGIAQRASTGTTPTPPPPTTLTPSADTPLIQTLAPGADTSPIQTSLPATLPPIPTFSSGFTETPTPAATPEPVSIISEFATLGQISRAVRDLIYANPGLADALARASSSDYANLRVFGLVPTLTSTFDYGIQAHFIDQDHTPIINAIKDLGFRWVKQQIRWADLEPSKGQIEWGEIDQLVNSCTAADIKILLSVVTAPTWARTAFADLIVDGPPANPQDLADFVAALAERYNGQVQAYEIWNEQNLHYSWGNEALDADRYVQLLAACYKAIKAKDPGAIVVSGALTPTGDNPPLAVDDLVYLERMYQAGLKNYCDAVGVHPGGYNVPPDADWQTWSDPSASFRGPADNHHHSWVFRGTMEGSRNVMVMYGDSSKRLWPTEFGWASTEGMGVGPNPGYDYAADNTEAEQAEWLVRAYEMGESWGWVGPMFCWNLNFWPIAGASHETARFSIVRGDWSPRPAYAALRDMLTPPTDTPIPLTPAATLIATATPKPTTTPMVTLTPISDADEYETAVVTPPVPDQVQAPDLVGLSREEGRRLAEEAGLQLAVVGERHDPSIPALNIITQTPPAGQMVGRGETIGIVISQGPNFVSVPAVEGLPITAAEPGLREMGLDIYQKAVWSNKEAEGIILSQEPPPGSIVSEGSVVTLITSSGPRLMLNANLDNKVLLIACDLDDDSLEQGETLRLVLYWRALQQIAENYAVFVHVARADGTTLVQRDVQPRDGTHPTSSWVTDELVTDPYELSIPSDALTDIYWLKVGMYSPATMQRLPVVDPGEATVLQDGVLVKELRVVLAQ